MRKTTEQDNETDATLTKLSFSVLSYRINFDTLEGWGGGDLKIFSIGLCKTYHRGMRECR